MRNMLKTKEKAGDWSALRAARAWLAAGLVVMVALAGIGCARKPKPHASARAVEALAEAADQSAALAGAAFDMDAYLADKARGCFGVNVSAGLGALGLGAAGAGTFEAVEGPADNPVCVVKDAAGAVVMRIAMGEARVADAPADDPLLARPSGRAFVELAKAAAAGGASPARGAWGESPSVDLAGASLPLPLYFSGFGPAGAGRIGLSLGQVFALVEFPRTDATHARAVVLSAIVPALEAVNDGAHE